LFFTEVNQTRNAKFSQIKFSTLKIQVSASKFYAFYVKRAISEAINPQNRKSAKI